MLLVFILFASLSLIVFFFLFSLSFLKSTYRLLFLAIDRYFSPFYLITFFYRYLPIIYSVTRLYFNRIFLPIFRPLFDSTLMFGRQLGEYQRRKVAFDVYTFATHLTRRIFDSYEKNSQCTSMSQCTST